MPPLARAVGWRVLAVALVVVSPAVAQQGAAPPTDTAPAPARPMILLTNDDGYDAPGLQALIKAFAGYGDVYVAAPAANQTAKGHSLNLSEAVVVRERHADGVVQAYAMEATPATSALLGFGTYLPRRPDLVVSGINRGENLGVSVYLSGTLGAARQAVFNGIPAIAVSMAGNDPADYEKSAAFLRRLVEEVRATGLLRPGFFLNVNVPGGTPKGVAVARLSVRPSQPQYECTPAVGGKSACFPTRYAQVLVDEAGTDVGEFYKGYITLTPMTLDVTDAGAMEPLRGPAATAEGERHDP